MQTRLAAEFASARGHEAATLLKSCVHCGFCTATCPTYQLLGDELDGPRGRISLIQQVLEGEAPTARTQLHLDRCLTCRACETTCPSGVQYGRLLDIGRQIVEEKVPRSFPQRIWRQMLAAGLTGPLFAPLLRLARGLRPVLPSMLKAKIPRRTASADRRALRYSQGHSRRMLLLNGCVQPAISPDIDAAMTRILDRLGIELVTAPRAGCCGAIHHHLTQQRGALEEIRRNVDAWWPHVESGIEAIVATASGCGTMLRDYGHLLRHDPLYAERAARISGLSRDPVELLAAMSARLADRMRPHAPQRVAFQSPCSLQHGLKLRGAVESLLTGFGAELVPVADPHLCCGSAGTYSLLQSRIAQQLGRAKVDALMAQRPDVILSANIGCIVQIGALADIPVRHWIEWLDERLLP